MTSLSSAAPRSTRDLVVSFFFLTIRPPPRSTLFPYTTPSDLPAVAGRLGELRDRLEAAAREIPGSRVAGSTALRVCKDRKSTRLNSSHSQISYAVFCLKKKCCSKGPYLPKTRN